MFKKVIEKFKDVFIYICPKPPSNIVAVIGRRTFFKLLQCKRIPYMGIRVKAILNFFPIEEFVNKLLMSGLLHLSLISCQRG